MISSPTKGCAKIHQGKFAHGRLCGRLWGPKCMLIPRHVWQQTMYVYTKYLMCTCTLPERKNVDENGPMVLGTGHEGEFCRRLSLVVCQRTFSLRRVVKAWPCIPMWVRPFALPSRQGPGPSPSHVNITLLPRGTSIICTYVRTQVTWVYNPCSVWSPFMLSASLRYLQRLNISRYSYIHSLQVSS